MKDTGEVSTGKLYPREVAKVKVFRSVVWRTTAPQMPADVADVAAAPKTR